MSTVTTLVPKNSTRRSKYGNHRKKIGKKFAYLTHVDGLRGFAIGLVVFFHVFIGKVSSGVDVFLLIGGLLFLATQMRNASNPDGLTFTQSFIRIIRRLAPTLIITTFIITIAAMIIYPPAEWWRIFRDTSSAVLYFINWTFAFSGESYIAAGQEASLLQHMWSMSVQLQIYLLLMIIIYSTAQLFNIRKYKNNNAWEKTVYIIVGILTVLSFSYATWLVNHNQTLNYYSTFSRFWEIGLGALFGALLLNNIVFTRVIRHILGIIGFILIIFTGIVLNGVEQFPGYLTIVPLLGALLIICSGQLTSSEERTWSNLGIIRILETKIFKFVGKISYSLYLWHWPLLILAIHFTDSEKVSLWLGIIVIISSIILATLTYNFVEKPLRQKEKPSRSNAFSLNYIQSSWRKSDVIWKPIMAIVLVIGCSLLASSPLLFTANNKIQTYAAEKAIQKYGGVYKTYPGAKSLVGDKDYPQDVPIQPNPDNDVKDMMPPTWYDGCYTGFGNEELVLKNKDGEDCYYGDKTSQKTLYVIGGSHSEQYMSALDDIGKKRNIRILPIIKMGCPMVNEGKWNGGDFTDCDKWAEKANQWIIDNPPTMGVLLTSTRPQTILGKGQDMVPSGYHDVFKRYDDAGIHIYAIRDNPWMMQTNPDTGEITDTQKDVRLCISNGKSSEECGTEQKNTLSEKNPAIDAYKDIKNITHIDFTPLFCQEGKCPAIIGNVLVYRDSHHLTSLFVKTMSPFIENELFKK